MTSWKKFIALASSAIVLATAGKWLYACGDSGDYADLGGAFFLDDISRNVAYYPFHYTAESRYYDGWWGYADSVELPDENIAEWKAYTGGKMAEDDLALFVYRFPYDELKNLYDHLEKQTKLELTTEAGSNPMTAWFQQGKDLEALGYLMYAKQCEKFAANGGSDWELPERDTAAMGKLIRNGLQLHKAAKKDFFRWRYAFQVVRLAFYAEQYPHATELYQSLIGERVGQGYLYARCLELRGGILFRTKKNAEAAYWFSRAFDVSDSRKRPAMLGFDWALTGGDTKPTMVFCKTDHERAVVHIMDAMIIQGEEHNDALDLMEEAYRLDPKVGGLDEAMTRELSRLEDPLMRAPLYDYRYAGWELSRETPGIIDSAEAAEQREAMDYAGKLALFAERVSRAGASGTPAYWHLATGYLRLMRNEPTAASAALDKAAALKPVGRLRDQQEILRALAFIRSKPTLDAATEAAILPTMQWLEKGRERDWRLERTYRNMLRGALTAAYLQQGDTAKAILSLSRLKSSATADSVRYGDEYSEWMVEDFEDEPGQLLQLVAMSRYAALHDFVARGGATPFDKWLLRPNPYTTTVLKEMEGTRWLRMLEFDKAGAAFAGVGEGELKIRMLRDPFQFSVRYWQEWSAADSQGMITKKHFAGQMALLKKEAAQPNASSGSLYRYGLGLFAMTHYGRDAHAFTYYRSGNDDHAYYQSAERAKMRPEYRNYYSASEALAVFTRAYEAAGSDPVLRARCAYLAALCWQVNAPELKTGEYDWNGDQYRLNALKNPWFAKLKALPDNAVTNQLSTACAYYQDYLKVR